MKKTFDNQTNVTISGFDLNNIADFADIDTAALIINTSNIIEEAELNGTFDETHSNLAVTVIKLCSGLQLLNTAITNTYKNANNNSRP